MTSSFVVVLYFGRSQSSHLLSRKFFFFTCPSYLFSSSVYVRVSFSSNPPSAQCPPFFFSFAAFFPLFRLDPSLLQPLSRQGSFSSIPTDFLCFSPLVHISPFFPVILLSPPLTVEGTSAGNYSLPNKSLDLFSSGVSPESEPLLASAPPKGMMLRQLYRPRDGLRLPFQSFFSSFHVNYRPSPLHALLARLPSGSPPPHPRDSFKDVPHLVPRSPFTRAEDFLT